MKKARLLFALLTAVAVLGAGAYFLFFTKSEPVQAPAPAQTNIPTPTQPEATYDFNDPAGQYYVVNKKRPLPKGYVPADLVVPNVRLRLGADQEQMQTRKLIEPALIEMFNEAKVDGITLVYGSGYRSEKLQTSFYNQYTKESGQAAADTFSARPSHSEHQTGLAFDVTTANGSCHLEVCFADTPEGKWVAQHAHKYGFIIRYQEGKTAITGYQYEPWHLRYLGKEVAGKINADNTTLEEFAKLEPAAQY